MFTIMYAILLQVTGRVGIIYILWASKFLAVNSYPRGCE